MFYNIQHNGFYKRFLSIESKSEKKVRFAESSSNDQQQTTTTTTTQQQIQPQKKIGLFIDSFKFQFKFHLVKNSFTINLMISEPHTT